MCVPGPCNPCVSPVCSPGDRREACPARHFSRSQPRTHPQAEPGVPGEEEEKRYTRVYVWSQAAEWETFIYTYILVCVCL